MYYVLTEWDGKGSREKVFTTTFKKDALAKRKRIFTPNQAESAWGYDYFHTGDVPCSTIDTYKDKKAIEENEPIKTENWY
jgi:hypothetical protein